MKVVQPIRDKKKIAKMIKILSESNMRDCMLFEMGIYTGLRISDILKFKVRDVKGQSEIYIQEQKTSKPKIIPYNDELLNDLKLYIKNMDDDDYLFSSRKGNNVPISRVQAYRILNAAASKVGLEEIGTHTMRKTFGYWHYKKFNDIALLQIIFNHSSQGITLKYIGITQDKINESVKKMSFKDL